MLSLLVVDRASLKELPDPPPPICACATMFGQEESQ